MSKVTRIFILFLFSTLRHDSYLIIIIIIFFAYRANWELVALCAKKMIVSVFLPPLNQMHMVQHLQ